MSRKSSTVNASQLPLLDSGSSDDGEDAVEIGVADDIDHVVVSVDDGGKSTRPSSPAPEPPSVVACIFAWPMRQLGFATETEE